MDAREAHRHSIRPRADRVSGLDAENLVLTAGASPSEKCRLGSQRKLTRMQIDFLGIQAFLSIVECGSFQLAGNQLNLSQAAVSHRLRKLEDSLGVRLISRTSREVALTDAGRTFLPRARAAFRELASSVAAVRSQENHRTHFLAISFLPTMGAALLAPVIREFSEKHPEYSVRVYDNSIHEIPELVESRSAAFGVTVALPLRGELVQEKIADEPFVLVCRRDHRFAERAQVRWKELSDEPLIRIALPFDNHMTIEDAIGPMRDKLRWRFETQRHALALQMVREGLGLAAVPQLHIAPGDPLVTIPIVEPIVCRTLMLVTRRNASLSVTEAEFKDRIIARIQEQLEKPLEEQLHP